MNSRRLIYAIALLLITLLLPISGIAQELNCKVEINSDKVSNVSKEVFKTLENAMSEYMNTNRWSNAQFLGNEKIGCTLFFTIKSYADNIMSGDLQIQSTRPVYNSSYTTTLINFKDNKIEFSYQENEPLIFSETAMESNLTAILNFYAYLILAVDFDSFSPNGGEPYFEKATEVVRLAQSSGESGWKAFEDTKNRSAVLSAFTDKNTGIFREMWYMYHRKGLDDMALSIDKGRAAVSESLNTLTKIHNLSPMTVVLSMFKDAKLDELVNIYSKANMGEKEKIYELLYPLYPTEGERLQKIKEVSKN
ncbi:MAG: DUF4835 family protein [Muribaculaceae bacterium]